MILAIAVVSALVIVAWAGYVRLRGVSVRAAATALLTLALAPTVFLYSAWVASDAWLSEHVGRGRARPFDDFFVAGVVSTAVIVGGILVGWEAGRQRRWGMTSLCACAGALALASLGVMAAMLVLLGLLSQIGSTVGGGWR